MLRQLATRRYSQTLRKNNSKVSVSLRDESPRLALVKRTEEENHFDQSGGAYLRIRRPTYRPEVHIFFCHPVSALPIAWDLSKYT